jgi:hypothetical protein
MTVARPGEKVNVMGRGFFTSDDGPLMYTMLDSFFSGTLGAALEKEQVRVEDIESCLVSIVDGTSVTAWINFPTILWIVAKREVKVHQAVRIDDIADVRDLKLDGVELPTRGALAYTFQTQWRRAFYFDFSMNQPPTEHNRPLANVAALLGSLHASLILRERIRMAPDVLERMFKAGWFPFVHIPHDHVVALYRQFQQGWDHTNVEQEIVRTVSPDVPRWLESWKAKAAFAPHIGALTTAVEHFGRGEYLAASNIVLPKVEGILRTLAIGRGKQGARALQRNLVARVRAQVSGATALLPEAFVEYLEDYYYAGFDLDANDVPPSRHAFMHGVGPDDLAAQPAFALRLFLTIDQLFFYV